MTDELTTQSPCNKTCKLNAQKMCVGCGRVLSDIAEWAGATPERLDEMNKAAKKRLENHQAIKSESSNSMGF